MTGREPDWEMVKADLDKRDIVILEELQRDCRQSARSIAKKTGFPTSTVFKKIKRLEGDGVIEGYHAVLNRNKVGLPETAIVLIEEAISEGSKGKWDHESMLDEIGKIPNILEAHLLTGAYDIILKVAGKNPRDIGKYVMNRLRCIPDIGKSYTSMVVYSSKETLEVPLGGHALCEREEYKRMKKKVEGYSKARKIE